MRTLVLFQEKELTAFFTSMLSGEGKMLTKADVEKQLKKYDYATASAPDFFFECPHSSAEGITLQEFLRFATSREDFLVKISLPPASVQSTSYISIIYLETELSPAQRCTTTQITRSIPAQSGFHLFEQVRMFNEFDLSGSSSINRHEFKRALESVRLAPTEDQCRVMIAAIDRPSGPNGECPV